MLWKLQHVILSVDIMIFFCQRCWPILAFLCTFSTSEMNRGTLGKGEEGPLKHHQNLYQRE
jgi:hypothetical protein